MQHRSLILSGISLLALPVLGQNAFGQTVRDNPMSEDLRRSLEHDPSAPVLGNPDDDVTGAFSKGES